MVQLRIETGDNRSGYEKPFKEFIDLTEEVRGLSSSEEKRLVIINRLLAEQRIHALDHERGGRMFHGAALLHTVDGLWLLQANMQLQNADTTRNCAEANSSTEARGYEGRNLQIKELWFMGGSADFDAGQAFLGNIGQRHTPCGSCRDVIYNNRSRIGEDTVVHMVPLNDGSWHLLPGDPDDQRNADEIEPTRIFSRRISDLLPHVTFPLADRNGAQKSMMIKGYEWIYDPGARIAMTDAMQSRDLKRLRKLENDDMNGEKRLHAINTLLMRAAKDWYQKTRVKPTMITIAIVRAADGKYYMGKYLKNGDVPSSSAAEIKALNAMTQEWPDTKFTDVFLLHFDQKEVENLRDPGAASDDIAVPMPDGATREILKKFAPRNGDALQTRDFLGKTLDQSLGNVHVFLPNNPDSGEFDPKRHVISMTVKQLLPYAYQNPKGVEAVSAVH